MTVEYGKLTPDELVDLFIDERGLAPYIETQQQGIPYEDWDWRRLTADLMTFSRGYLTFSPEYLHDLYEMQKAKP